MIHQTIPMPYGGKENAKLTLYVPDYPADTPVKIHPTMLIFPGGGYGALSDRESECVALRFLSMGFTAAVLYYSIGEDAVFPQSLCEAALAIAYLKEHAEEYQIDTNRIYTCGFSAGAHLALSLGVFWDKAWLAEAVGKENELLRPAAQVICYPVVSSDPELRHEGSFRRLMGGKDSPERLELLSLDKQVSSMTPPTFLWTTQVDKTVHCENSLLLASALQKHGVITEFHFYSWGRHGLALCNRITQRTKNVGTPRKSSHVNPHIATWIPLCQEWLEELCGVEMTITEDESAK